MSDEQPEKVPLVPSIELPDELRAGVPADRVSIWTTPESFVMDFLAQKEPIFPADDDNGNPVGILDYVVSARVRMPPTHVFEFMKALEAQLSQWETRTGQRAAVEPPHPDLEP